jgi:hypothetical protein
MGRFTSDRFLWDEKEAFWLLAMVDNVALCQWSSPSAIDYKDCSIQCNSSLSSGIVSISPLDVLNRRLPLVAFTIGVSCESEWFW